MSASKCSRSACSQSGDDGYQASLVLQMLGEGAFGQVWKCRDKKTGEIVAVKIMSVESEDAVGRLS
mgnify:CR=1 FL=1